MKEGDPTPAQGVAILDTGDRTAAGNTGLQGTCPHGACMLGQETEPTRRQYIRSMRVVVSAVKSWSWQMTGWE